MTNLAETRIRMFSLIWILTQLRSKQKKRILQKNELTEIQRSQYVIRRFLMFLLYTGTYVLLFYFSFYCFICADCLAY